MHTVQIKRFDQSLPLPAYQSAGAAGIDLAARVQTTIAAHQIALVPLNVGLQLPEGTWALLAARSSLSKKGLMLANGIGVGDYDYRGNDDEYRAVLYNFSDQEVVVERGERIVQLIVLTYDRVTLVEASQFVGTTNRGGFGSTGK